MSEQETTKQEGKLMNRWIIVVAAVLVQFALGAVYSFSFLQKPIMSFIVGLSTITTANYKDAGLTSTSLLPFAFALLFFSVAMIPAGRWQDKKGPKIVALTGGVILVAGIFLACLVVSMPSGGSVWGLVVTYGMIGGLGIGFAYVCPIACATKWFPDKIGLINGLAVAGFGAGSILFNVIYYYAAAPISGIYQLPTTSLLLGAILMAAFIFPGAFVLRNPPAGYKPAGWEPPKPAANVAVVENWTTSQMVKTPTFYGLWIMYICSAICGLMVIGNFLKYGQLIAPALTGDLVVAVAALAGCCNAVGRIVWGKISDKIGRVQTMKIMFIIQAAAMILFGLATYAGTGALVMWAIFGCSVYFCFGGNLSLFPAATRQFYGPKNMGLNYGVVFSAYGTAAILGALLAGPLLAAMSNSYALYFILFGCMSSAAFIVSFFTKTPTSASKEEKVAEAPAPKAQARETEETEEKPADEPEE